MADHIEGDSGSGDDAVKPAVMIRPRARPGPKVQLFTPLGPLTLFCFCRYKYERSIIP